MMEVSSRTGFHDLNLASRKAEEAALRRYIAVAWLESLLGPLGIPSQPSEREFISCLRNGLILCNAINIIRPGAVPKVVENNLYFNSISREFQPPPAFQYFENVRNFLVAIEELKLPAFEASDLERDMVEAGPAAAKVTDCILSLKSYHELKQISGGNGHYKHARSPMVLHSASKIYPRPLPRTRTCLDMSAKSDKQPPRETQRQEDALVKVLVEHMLDSKENIDESLLATFRKQNMASSFCLEKANVDHSCALQAQEKELLVIKALLSRTKEEFQELQSQFQIDFKMLGSQVEEMSTAALGYQKVVEENKKLYNMVQDLKGNIRVFCRIRPAFQAETNTVIDFIGKDGSLVVLDPSKSNQEGRKVFQFNQVFSPSSTQDEVFNETQPFIRSVMDGYNVCILAYGQTGSGKTYTMSGPSGGLAKDLGINHMALNELFQICNQRKDFATFDIRVQMVEIYNELVRDLLTANPTSTKLEIRTCSGEDGLILPDATMHPVKSSTDVVSLMRLGEVNRSVCSTAINNQSSRSHSILTVHVHGEELSGSVFHSRLHLVDLAGSERVDKSEVAGESMKEAQHINKSLSCLGDVISALSQKNSYIPYRNSKLTLLLQGSLGGNAKTLMFAHVSPEEISFGETMSTLKFAQRVTTVELGSARLNKETSEVIQLKEQIESLKKALASKDSQSAVSNKIKGPRSMNEKRKVISEKTPPRTRRLSLENGEAGGGTLSIEIKELRSSAYAKTKAMAERTPPRTRRLSIENGEPHGQLSSETKESRSTCNKLKPTTERTPPRIRRLSIENGRGTKTDKPLNLEEKKGPKTPSVRTRSRRLSLEGPKYTKNTLLTDAEASTKQLDHLDNNASKMEVYHPQGIRSPGSYQKRAVNLESRTKVPKLQLPDSTEPTGVDRSDIQIKLQGELTLSTSSRVRNGKGSQIRKSLRSTIGKLISGSEKRNPQAVPEAKSPIGNTQAVKSPTTENRRKSRRQSLTGIIQPPTPEKSRRSSLEGKPIDLSGIENRESNTSIHRARR